VRKGTHLRLSAGRRACDSPAAREPPQRAFSKPNVMSAQQNRFIEREALKAHSRVSSWRSLLTLAVVWGFVALNAWLASAVFGWWYTPIAVFLIGCMQHYLFMLLHETSHYAIHPNRAVNDVVSEIFLALPIGLRVKYYRHFHLRHHRHTRDEFDPELSLRRSMLCDTLTGAAVQGALGITALRATLWYSAFMYECRRSGVVKGTLVGDLLAFGSVWGPPIALAAMSGWLWGIFLYWLVPLACVYVPVLKMQGYCDHVPAPPAEASEFGRSLTRRFGRLSNFVFNPLHSGEHLAHHMYPSVPWYNLPAFVRQLEGNREYWAESSPWHLDGYFVGESTVFERVVLPDARAARNH
jgi:fatty acid desaturase